MPVKYFWIILKNLFNKPKIILYNNGNVEINSEITLNDLIFEIKNGELLTGDNFIDTSRLGKQTLTIEIDNKGKKLDKDIYINIIDTTGPIITYEDEIITEINHEIDLLENVTVFDNSNEEINIEIEGDYSFDKDGTYPLKYVAIDSSGNKTVKLFNLIVNKSQMVNGKLVDGIYKTSNGYELKIEDGVAYIDGLIIVNKSYPIPEDYIIANPAATVSKISCTNCLDKDTLEAFNLMKVDAKSIGLNIWIQSGYRSYYLQTTLYNNYAARDGKALADTYSARPGHSEHQTGYAFDLNTIDDSFQHTAEGKWVNSNCYLYGFIIRYPKGKEEQTGYMYESWHLRYVGKDLAAKLYNNGDWITIEEYFGITSVYPE